MYTENSMAMMAKGKRDFTSHHHHPIKFSISFQFQFDFRSNPQNKCTTYFRFESTHFYLKKHRNRKSQWKSIDRIKALNYIHTCVLCMEEILNRNSDLLQLFDMLFENYCVVFARTVRAISFRKKKRVEVEINWEKKI